MSGRRGFSLSCRFPRSWSAPGVRLGLVRHGVPIRGRCHCRPRSSSTAHVRDAMRDSSDAADSGRPRVGHRLDRPTRHPRRRAVQRTRDQLANTVSARLSDGGTSAGRSAAAGSWSVAGRGADAYLWLGRCGCGAPWSSVARCSRTSRIFPLVKAGAARRGRGWFRMRRSSV